MDRWPQITEQLLRQRQAMSDDEFFAFLEQFLGQLGARTLDDAHYEQAISYPWGRQPGSCFVIDGHVESAAGHPIGELGEDRLPLLAYGANASPERLALKLAHLPEGHRSALILAGELEGFDVSASAQPPTLLSMPATLVPSPGTRIRVAVLFLDDVQFTAIWWTELSYRLGALGNVRVVLDDSAEPLDRVLVFVSRYGAFCVDGEPAVMSAIEARDRRWPARTQEEIIDAAALLALGDGARARDLIRAAYERPADFYAAQRPRFQATSLPFESEHWTPMPA
jgi:hypothetical protein